MTIPKWTGSIPRATAAGIKRGARIAIAGPVSINIPIISSMILTDNKKTKGLLMALVIKSDIICGALSSVMIRLNPIANANRQIMGA